MLSAERFPEFFQAVEGHEPFPWQDELAQRLVEGQVPEFIDVPTGLGKTAAITAWVYALAAQAVANRERSVPLRMCFVIDRRLVVDEAYEHARRLEEALAPRTPGIVGEVSTALAGLTGGQASPLTVVRMRGGVTWDSRWLARPDQPALVVGTVDQYGSRLLFRGYGVSAGMRPVNAALVGTDTWLVVDEAHLAAALAQTVSTASTHQSRVEPLARFGLKCTQMSATGSQASGSSLRLDPEREMASKRFPAAADKARKRLLARKPAALVDAEHLAKLKKTGRQRQVAQLGALLGRIAGTLSGEGDVVGVVANTVRTARAAFEVLEASGEHAILLTGRCREFERARTINENLPRVAVGRDRPAGHRLFVVATQTVEVGANLDFDLLVTECAPLSSLAQRFGRVNRVGVGQVRRSAIVHAGFAHLEDAIYGQATENTWQYLTDVSGDIHLLGAKGTLEPEPAPSDLDFGPLEVRRLRDDARGGDRNVDVDPAFTPIAVGAHLARWAMTNPAPLPDQEVAPFLHGVSRGTPDVAVAWRADPPPLVDSTDNAYPWVEWVELVPPVDWEFVDVPIWEVRGLLTDLPPPADASDVEGALTPVEEQPRGDGEDRVLGVVYRPGAETPRVLRRPSDVRPGDRVILSSAIGGHDRWGWTGQRRAPSDPLVPDVAELVPSRRQSVQRLAPEVLATWLDADGTRALEDRVKALQPADEDGRIDPDELLEAFRAAGLPQVLGSAYESRGTFTETAFSLPGKDADRRRMQLMVGPREEPAPDSIRDDDAVLTSLNGREPVALTDHGAAVGRLAREFADHLGLSASLWKAVELAGRFHDLGKADKRFQVMLHGGDALAASGSPPRAKSGRSPRDPLARAAHRVSGLPPRFRHEAVSERLVAGLAEVMPDELDGVDPELLAHLVASHHGHARPLLPPVQDPDAPPVQAVVDGMSTEVPGMPMPLDWSHPARFERLNARYGWWGLALLETIVRLADIQCSEEGR